MPKNEVVKKEKLSPLAKFADQFGLEPDQAWETLKATVIKGEASKGEITAALIVANEYKLNPFLRQIHFFKGQQGLVPVVGIDGWVKMVNDKSNFDGASFQEGLDADGVPEWCSCKMYDKKRGHPIEITEHFKECYRNTNPWNQMPRRMLRHKAFMQAGRLSYGFGGVYDEDEARDIIKNAKDVVITDVKDGLAEEFIEASEAVAVEPYADEVQKGTDETEPEKEERQDGCPKDAKNKKKDAEIESAEGDARGDEDIPPDHIMLKQVADRWELEEGTKATLSEFIFDQFGVYQITDLDTIQLVALVGMVIRGVTADGSQININYKEGTSDIQGMFEE